VPYSCLILKIMVAPSLIFTQSPLPPLPHLVINAHDEVEKSLESGYPGPEAPALRPIHGFATAISKASRAAEPLWF